MARSSRSSNSQRSTVPWGEVDWADAEPAEADSPDGAGSVGKSGCSRSIVILILPAAKMAITGDSEAAGAIVSWFRKSRKRIFAFGRFARVRVYRLFTEISCFCLDLTRTPR